MDCHELAAKALCVQLVLIVVTGTLGRPSDAVENRYHWSPARFCAAQNFPGHEIGIPDRRSHENDNVCIVDQCLSLSSVPGLGRVDIRGVDKSQFAENLCLSGDDLARHTPNQLIGLRAAHRCKNHRRFGRWPQRPGTTQLRACDAIQQSALAGARWSGEYDYQGAQRVTDPRDEIGADRVDHSIAAICPMIGPDRRCKLESLQGISQYLEVGNQVAGRTLGGHSP